MKTCTGCDKEFEAEELIRCDCDGGMLLCPWCEDTHIRCLRGEFDVDEDEEVA